MRVSVKKRVELVEDAALLLRHGAEWVTFTTFGPIRCDGCEADTHEALVIPVPGQIAIRVCPACARDDDTLIKQWQLRLRWARGERG